MCFVLNEWKLASPLMIRCIQRISQSVLLPLSVSGSVFVFNSLNSKYTHKPSRVQQTHNTKLPKQTAKRTEVEFVQLNEIYVEMRLILCRMSVELLRLRFRWLHHHMIHGGLTYVSLSFCLCVSVWIAFVAHCCRHTLVTVSHVMVMGSCISLASLNQLERIKHLILTTKARIMSFPLWKRILRLSAQAKRRREMKFQRRRQQNKIQK